MGIAGFVLGLVGVIGSFIPVVNYIVPVSSIVGIVLSVLGRKKGKEKGDTGLATAGLVLNIIALVLGIFSIICITLCAASLAAAGANGTY